MNSCSSSKYPSMDYGFLSLDSFVGPTLHPPTSPNPNLGSEPQLNVKSKREEQEQHWRASKLPKTTTMPFCQDTVVRSDQMLSFSSNKSEPSFPFYQRNVPRSYTGSLNPMTNMHVGLNGFRGQIFTASQWIELEHQALIYKYLTSNVPVPSNLLLPLKKSLNPFAFPSSLVTSLPHSSFGWGSFHIGFGDNSDPEPGRCRRTDGKKWRCSRDAVADQKYCEKHINRGRHRSRKPVEGQQQAGQFSAAKTAAAVPKPAGTGSAIVNRTQDLRGGLSTKPNESTLVTPKQEPTFGLVSTNSLLNPSNTTYSDTFPDRHFVDNRPDEVKPEWTQLSMSIPVSPLRLSQKQPEWVPVSWGTANCSMGGPLGEVLTNTTSSYGWDGSPQLGTSPTGVLQKSTFGSMSNSSTGSSPRDGTKKSSYEDVLGSTLG